MEQRYQMALLGLALCLGSCGDPTPTSNSELGSVNDTMMDSANDMIMDANMSDPNLGLPTENQVASVPTCEHIPASGARLNGQRLSGEGHELRIDNGADGDAIVKIRNADTGRLVTSFFVRHHTSAGVSGLPDGSYIFQYAFGPALAADCKSFTEIMAADEFPSAGPFVSEPIEGGVRTRQLTYTLHSVPGGNIQPIAIDADAFNAG